MSIQLSIAPSIPSPLNPSWNPPPVPLGKGEARSSFALIYRGKP
ncbi:hypothetical protein L8106_30740, partial [Lyngbya sp. PCC 8106]